MNSDLIKTEDGNRIDGTVRIRSSTGCQNGRRERDDHKAACHKTGRDTYCRADRSRLRAIFRAACRCGHAVPCLSPRWESTNTRGETSGPKEGKREK